MTPDLRLGSSPMAQYNSAGVISIPGKSEVLKTLQIAWGKNALLGTPA